VTRKTQKAEEKLQALQSFDFGKDAAADVSTLQAALADSNSRVVAKAAQLAEQRLCYAAIPAMIAAFARFEVDGVKRDPRCFAKQAIARALVALDCDDAEFMRRGIALRQMEPVWGGSEDTAVDIRTTCAMGLVNSGYSRAIHELTQLLNDTDAIARQGAVRAIACCVPREAELLLRFKVLTGDSESVVLGECFVALLQVNSLESVPLVARYLSSRDSTLVEQAALALGGSRLPSALQCLQDAWGATLLTSEQRKILTRSAALHRSDAAYDWLLGLIRDASVPAAQAAIEALSIYKQNAPLKAKVAAAVEARAEPRLNDTFVQSWAIPEH
jgi:hypothetical protein